MAARQETSVQHNFNEPTKQVILITNPNPFFFIAVFVAIKTDILDKRSSRVFGDKTRNFEEKHNLFLTITKWGFFFASKS